MMKGVRIPNARNNEDEKIAKRAKYESQELSIVLPTAASRAFCRGLSDHIRSERVERSCSRIPVC